MSRDHEQWQTRRRHDSIVGLTVAVGFAVLWLGFQPEWLGAAPSTATFWFLRFVAVVLVVCAAGCVYRALKNRRSKTERELGLPPTTKR